MASEVDDTDVPPGKVATVVTYLEMLSPAPPRPAPPLDGVSLRVVSAPDTTWYRDLYTRIGAMDWLWSARLDLSPSALEEIIHHPRVQVYALEVDGRDEGLIELDFQNDGECELVFFGVTSATIGQGAGRFLMNHAIAHAWARPIRRFWLRTCTFDHPGALAFYMRSGFRAFHRQVVIADDPRLIGLLPETAAPNIPIIRP